MWHVPVHKEKGNDDTRGISGLTYFTGCSLAPCSVFSVPLTKIPLCETHCDSFLSLSRKISKHLFNIPAWLKILGRRIRRTIVDCAYCETETQKAAKRCELAKRRYVRVKSCEKVWTERYDICHQCSGLLEWTYGFSKIHNICSQKVLHCDLWRS